MLALIGLAIAVVFVVVDTSAGATGGLRWVVVRWFHPLCWVLLALAAVAMAKVTPLPAGWAVALAASSGVIYTVFLVATAIWRG